MNACATSIRFSISMQFRTAFLFTAYICAIFSIQCSNAFLFCMFTHSSTIYLMFCSYCAIFKRFCLCSIEHKSSSLFLRLFLLCYILFYSTLLFAHTNVFDFCVLFFLSYVVMRFSSWSLVTLINLLWPEHVLHNNVSRQTFPPRTNIHCFVYCCDGVVMKAAATNAERGAVNMPLIRATEWKRGE